MRSDFDWMETAYGVARLSLDESTQNGAVIVSRTGVFISAACNNFPRSVAFTEERRLRPLKYAFTEHAERNAIYDAALLGRCTREAVMFCPWAPCADCARGIIQAGIAELVTHDHEAHRSRDGASWGPSIETGLVMLAEAGVRHRVVGGTFGMEIRFDGELIEV